MGLVFEDQTRDEIDQSFVTKAILVDGFQNVIELIVEKLDGVVMGTMGKVAGPKFVNYISTIFIFIFMSNRCV